MPDNGITQSRVLRLDPRDNVLVALTELRQGERVSVLGNEYVLLSDVRAKHKFVMQDVAADGEIIMYGVLVGRAVKTLRRGELLSTSNISHAAAGFHETEKVGRRWVPPDVTAWRKKTFLGYHRTDGQVGARNYWLVLPLVFCENRNLGVLKQAFEEELGFAAPQIYRRQVAELVRLYREGKTDELRTLTFGEEAQQGKPSPKVFRNIDGIKFLMHEGGCGSDGFSGLSANPAIGHTADLVAALGGKGILSEFPELCGVEQELIERCARKEVASRFAQLMRDYAARAKAVRSGFEMNPSPGNIRDGLLTDAMKSAGAAKKGGTSPVTAVLDYPEYSNEPGLKLQCTPGNDVECVTAQVGAGANVVLFTTGLGTPTGNPIAPVVKISTNSQLARRMQDIIDIDAGAIIAGEKTIKQMGEEILDFVSGVASGTIHTKAELLQQNDFIPWKRGVSL